VVSWTLLQGILLCTENHLKFTLTCPSKNLLRFTIFICAVFIAPSLSFSEYKDLFPTVDFGAQGNTFLRLCGAKDRPTVEDLALKLTSQPEDVRPHVYVYSVLVLMFIISALSSPWWAMWLSGSCKGTFRPLSTVFDPVAFETVRLFMYCLACI
jgi:hypothetical protein